MPMSSMILPNGSRLILRCVSCAYAIGPGNHAGASGNTYVATPNSMPLAGHQSRSMSLSPIVIVNSSRPAWLGDLQLTASSTAILYYDFNFGSYQFVPLREVGFGETHSFRLAEWLNSANVWVDRIQVFCPVNIGRGLGQPMTQLEALTPQQ